MRWILKWQNCDQEASSSSKMRGPGVWGCPFIGERCEHSWAKSRRPWTCIVSDSSGICFDDKLCLSLFRMFVLPAARFAGGDGKGTWLILETDLQRIAPECKVHSTVHSIRWAVWNTMCTHSTFITAKCPGGKRSQTLVPVIVVFTGLPHISSSSSLVCKWNHVEDEWASLHHCNPCVFLHFHSQKFEQLSVSHALCILPTRIKDWQGKRLSVLHHRTHHCLFTGNSPVCCTRCCRAWPDASEGAQSCCNYQLVQHIKPSQAQDYLMVHAGCGFASFAIRLRHQRLQAHEVGLCSMMLVETCWNVLIRNDHMQFY